MPAFLAWRDWGFPDASVFNGFGMGALRCRDGAFVLGEMGQHTSNAGRIYFPSGTPDLDDISGGAVDIPGSVAREVEEETGLCAADYRAGGHWDCVVSGAVIAMIRILDVDLTGEALRARIEANLARQRQPELSAVHLVRGRRRSHRGDAALCRGVCRSSIFGMKFVVIARSASDEAIHFLRGAMDCFASLAMTNRAGADPCGHVPFER